MIEILGGLSRKVRKDHPKDLGRATISTTIRKGVGATTVVSHMFANIARRSIPSFYVKSTVYVVMFVLTDGQGVLKGRITKSSALNEPCPTIRIVSNRNQKYQDKMRLITMT